MPEALIGDETMIFRLLGPLEAGDAGSESELGGMRQRATLSLLLLNANRVVSTSCLLESLWEGAEPPPTARKVIQNAIWSLRRHLASLGDEAVLSTRPPGYILQIDLMDVDLYRFERLADHGRDMVRLGRIDEGIGLFREGLALWRGPALADLVEAGMNWPVLTRLEEQKRRVLEDYFEACLSIGKHSEILNELSEVFESDPLRERVAEMLMVSLYRLGRQVDALKVYNRVRASLQGELGLEPAQRLQRVQSRVLKQESLDSEWKGWLDTFAVAVQAG